jgi:hypothetical protein
MTMRCLALLALLPLAAACGDAAAHDPIALESTCAETQRVGGEIAAWESAGWPPDPRCDWLPFDGRTTVDLSHGLGRPPRSVEVYISFDPDGHMSTPASGDVTRIVGADAESVQLRNAQNEDFFLKVVLR